MVGMKNLMGTLTIASSTLLTGCSGTSVYERAEQYMQDKPQTEFNEVVNNRNYFAHSSKPYITIKIYLLLN